jgi:hypothetical protein
VCLVNSRRLPAAILGQNQTVILRKPSGEVAESTFLALFWILRLRFAARRMTNKKAMPQYHDLC